MQSHCRFLSPRRNVVISADAKRSAVSCSRTQCSKTKPGINKPPSSPHVYVYRKRIHQKRSERKHSWIWLIARVDCLNLVCVLLDYYIKLSVACTLAAEYLPFNIIPGPIAFCDVPLLGRFPDHLGLVRCVCLSIYKSRIPTLQHHHYLPPCR
ncbi:hypothetical protein QCA50_020326 [Cerrena zonata]|uniref:Uncharacterized protein n=1 Tax=Cerrena zonata TaxID=2478898 RepID=A0AAW0FBX7_9APHY